MSQEYIYFSGNKDPFTNELYTQTTIVYRNDKNEIHRDNDLPAIILADGTMFWVTNGKLNRTSVNYQQKLLPAVIDPVSGGHKFCIDGKLVTQKHNCIELNLYK